MSLSMNDREYLNCNTNSNSNLKNPNKILILEDIIKKRKDPKTMTVEELEEYISLNKSKFKEGGVSSMINNTNKSLNSSSNSQKILSRSFTAGKNAMSNNLINNNIGIKPQSNDPNVLNLSKVNDNILNKISNQNQINENAHRIEKEKDCGNENSYLHNSYINSNFEKKYPNNTQLDRDREYTNIKSINSSPINSMNPFLNNLPSSKQKYFHNFVADNLSSCEENNFNLKNEQLFQENINLNNNNNNNINSGISTNSSAGNNYLKSLQNKNSNLVKETEELKKHFIEVSEILEKERNDFQKKIINEINKGNEVEKSLKQELNFLHKENKDLKEKLNESKEKIAILNQNNSILENDKERHLDQNALEKEKLNIHIEKTGKDLEEFKKKISKIESENRNLKDSLQKKIEDFQSIEKNFQFMKEENMAIKMEFRDKINKYNKEIENVSNRYESEREELLENIKALNNIVKQLDGEKKDLMKKYEKNMKELTVKINRLERNSLNNNNYKENKIEKFSPGMLAKSKEKAKNYSTNLSTSTIKEMERKQNKTKELKISSKVTIKNNATKKAKSPCNKKLSTSLNANEISQSNNSNNYINDYSSRVDKSSRKNSRSNSKSSSRIKKNTSHLEKDNSNLKISQISLLSGFGTNSLGFLSPMQTNASLENISTLNTNLLNQHQFSYNDHNTNKHDEVNSFKIFSTQTQACNKDEFERNNYLNIINNTIYELERNIADMNRNYKNLMIKLNTTISQEESSLCKRNINAIANNLQEQSEKLLDLKGKQQELLKTSLRNNRF